MYTFDDYFVAANYIKNIVSYIPEVAIVIGSGLRHIVDLLECRQDILYKDIPCFPKNEAHENDWMLSFGRLGRKWVLVQNGYFHYYDGNSLDTTIFPVRVFKLLGIKKLLITCAVGGINEDFKYGDIILINDHLKFGGDSPLRGVNIAEFGERFVDISTVYSKRLINLATNFDNSLKTGVYAYMQGPNFETPAEIRALRLLGADVVGMAVVPCVIAAAQVGIEVMVISHISSMAAGINNTSPKSHSKSSDVKKQIFNKFSNLLNYMVNIDEE